MPVYGYEEPGLISVDELTFDDIQLSPSVTQELTACQCALDKVGEMCGHFFPLPLHLQAGFD